MEFQPEDSPVGGYLGCCGSMPSSTLRRDAGSSFQTWTEGVWAQGLCLLGQWNNSEVRPLQAYEVVCPEGWGFT